MSSKKPSAKAKRVREFKAQLGDMSGPFAREQRQRANRSAQHEAALRKKTCESKNRYLSQAEAQLVIEERRAYGVDNLHEYRCPYCDGWHLTSRLQ